MPAQFISQTRVSPLASQSSVTSTSFSVQAGDVLVAFAMSGTGSTSGPISINDSMGLTWTKRAEVSQTTSIMHAIMWTATVPTTATMSYGFTRPASSPPWTGAVQVWRGVSSIGNSNSAQSSPGQPAVTLTTNANSTVVMASADNTAIDGTTTYNEADGGTFTATAGYPLVSLFSYAFYAGYYADTGAAGTKTFGITYPNAQNYSIVAVELRSVVTEILSDGEDGYIMYSGPTYSTVKEGTSGTPTVVNTGGTSIGQMWSGTNYLIAESFFKFNVSTLTNYVNPSLKFYAQFADNPNPDFDVEIRVFNWGATLTTADFVPGSQLSSKTPIVATVNTANWPTTDNTLVPLTVDSVALAGAIEAAKAADGWLYLVANSSLHRLGTAPTGNLGMVGFNGRDINGDAGAAKLTFQIPSGPVVSVELYEAGVFKQFLGAYEITADGVVSFPWDASVLSAISGADVELRLTSDADLDVGAIEWNAVRTAASIPVSTAIESWGVVLM